MYKTLASSLHLIKLPPHGFPHTCRNIADSFWSTAGVNTTNVTETEDGVFEVVCVSSHFTSFAVLMDVTGALNVSALHETVLLHEVELFTLSHSISSRNTAIVQVWPKQAHTIAH